MKINKLHFIIVILLLLIISILVYKMMNSINYEKIRYYENFKSSNKYPKMNKNNKNKPDDNWMPKIIINGKDLDENRCTNWKLNERLLTANCIETVSGVPNKVSLKLTRDCKTINCVNNKTKKAKLKCNTC